MTEQSPDDRPAAGGVHPPPSRIAPTPPPLAYPPPQPPPHPAPYATPYTPTAAPPMRSRGPLFIIVLFVVVVVAGIVTFAVRNHRPTVVRQEESAEQRRAAALAAFGEGAPVDVSDVKQVEGIRTLFTDFTRAARNRDGKAMSDCFDIPRLCDEVAATKLPGTGQFTDPKVQDQLAPGLGMSMTSNAQNFAWEGFEIRQIKPLPQNDEVMVYLRADHGEGYRGKFRFWLRRGGGKWRIYDFEELAFGVRSTTLVGSLMGASLSGSTAQANAVLGVLQTIQAGNQQIRDEDFPGALKTLRTADGQSGSTPKPLEALRQTLMAAAYIRLSDPDAAMQALDKSESLHADQPYLALLRGAAYNASAEPDKALEQLGQYENLVGPEALSYYHGGEAHLLKGQSDLALDRFRKGLDDTPSSLECFEGLCRTLGEEGLAELRQRLSLMADPSTALRATGNAAIVSRDPATLATSIQLFADDSDPFLAYFQAELHILSNENEQAVRVFEANAERFKAEPLLADAFADEYIVVLNRVGRSLDAYRLSKEKQHAFVDAAEALLEREDIEQLQKLIDMHVVQKPGEASIVNHYRGLIAEHRKQPAEAERLLKLALDNQVAQDWKDAHQQELIRVMYQAGRHAEAYQALGPKWEVFEAMAGYAHRYRQAEPLRQLLTLVAKDFPTHESLPWYESSVAWMNEDYKACADLLLKHRAKLTTEERTWALNYRLVAALIRSGRPTEAVAHVEWARNRDKGAGDYIELLAYAAAGQVPEATQRLTKLLAEEEMTLSEYLEDDEDLTRALSAPAFASWMAEQRKAGPATAPVTRPATAPASAPAVNAR